MNGLLERAPSAGTVAAKPLRIRHVDSLRAIAAGLVVWTHLDGIFFPFSVRNPAFLDFLHTLPTTLILGRVGVNLFFAVSGFVISRSFGGPKEGTAQRFLIRRFCRLYPAFWVSLLTAMLSRLLEGHALTLPSVAANATMMPKLFGQETLIGLYWTLQIELIFYALCLGLQLLGRLDHRMTLAVFALVLAAARRILHMLSHRTGLDLEIPGDGGTWVLSLGLMFWGAFFRSVYEETGGFRRAPLRCPGTWLLLLLTLAIADLYDPHVKIMLLHGTTQNLGERLSTLDSLAFFALWVAVLRVETRLLTFLGVISYSLYLFHPFVMTVLTSTLQFFAPASRPALPLWLYLIVGVLLSTVLATVVYRWVEHPAIAFGKRWVERKGLLRPARPSNDAVQ